MEKENILQLVDQEMEEVEFPVGYEMEWLNEHMEGIFSGDQWYGLHSSGAPIPCPAGF